MFENIKVSVITPTYNDEKYIRETIESVLCQTHKNLELIIIDDCSSDKTTDVVKSFKDERIVLVANDRNRGAAYARNLGISKATGDYIAFLDGDDVWEPHKLERQIQFMEKDGYAFSATRYSLIDGSGKRLGLTVSAPQVMTNKMLRKTCYIGCLTAMYRRAIYPDLSIPDSIRKRNDYALWLKLSERTNCYFLDENLAWYRKRGDSISSGNKFKLIKYHIKMYRILYGYSYLRSTFLALRNCFYYVLRKKKFARRGGR